MVYSYESHYFEDFEGDEKFQSVGRTVTKADFMMHSALSGDQTELRMNSEYTGDTQFGQRIARGPMTFVQSAGLIYWSGIIERTVVAFLRMNYMDLPNPVFIGDTLSQTMVISEREDLGNHDDTGLVVLEIEVTKQDGTVVLEGDMRFPIKTKLAAE